MNIDKKTIEAAQGVQKQAKQLLKDAEKYAEEASNQSDDDDKKQHLEKMARESALKARELTKAARNLLKVQ